MGINDELVKTCRTLLPKQLEYFEKQQTSLVPSISQGRNTMTTNSDSPNKDLLEPVVFQADFNNFEKINQNQAWSLFLTGGRNDKLIGKATLFGWLLTSILVAIALFRIF